MKKINFVFLLIATGFILRIININWGAPFYFHPDERNIASLLSLDPFEKFPSYLFKGTFSYGNFPSLFLQVPRLILLNFNLPINVFVLSTLILRLTSVIFSALTLIIIYKTGNLFSKKIGFIALSLAAFSTGLIQNAHFGTYDTFIAFWISLSFYFSLLLVKYKKGKYFYFAAISLCVAASAKITSISFFPIISLPLFFLLREKDITKKFFILYLLFGIVSFAFVFILSPYYTTPDFLNLIKYERGVVTGSLDVFYTQSFNKTTPILYHLTDIFPFLINPIVTLLLPLSIVSAIIPFIRTRNKKILLTLLGFLILFIPQTVLFAKWSRYMLPTLPFIYLLVSIFLSSLLKTKNDTIKKGAYILIGFTIAISFIHALSYILLTKESTVIKASSWASKNIPPNSLVLSEQYDLGIIAFNRNLSNIVLFDFYTLDEKTHAEDELHLLLNNADYVLLPSQRILKSRLSNPTLFPKGYDFYSKLYYEKGNFRKIYETQCSIWCNILYFGNPIFTSEETTSVFDRPTVSIYKKIR